MKVEQSQREKFRLVLPRAMKNYAQGLGWKPVTGLNGTVAVYHDPNSELRQLLVPLDEKFDDYPESVARVVERLAEFEKRDPAEVLNHLLVPPSDLLSFREQSAETEAGDISVEHGSRIIEGVKKALLAIAHSVEQPQAFHPRLSRDEAKQFLSRCRMSTTRGSFVLNVACLLDTQVALPGMEPEPFTRKVTSLFMDTLSALLHASSTQDASKLLDTATNQGISANFCEALVQMRPLGDRAQTVIKAEWSRTRLPKGRQRESIRVLQQEVFEIAETLAPRLRSLPASKQDMFFGFVEELKGTSSVSENRPSGEVRLLLLDQEEELKAKVELNAEDYARAGEAHLNQKPVLLYGNLIRSPRINRIENVTLFDLIQSERPNGN